MQQFKRWITAVILIPFLLLLLIKGSVLLLTGLVSIVSILTIREYLAMTPDAAGQKISANIRTVTLVFSAAIPLSAITNSWQVVLLILVLNFIVMALFVLSGFSSNKDIINTIAKQLLGIIYIPLSLSILVFIRQMDQGILWLIWLLIVVFADDTGAFYTGTYLGKKRLAAGISPKKTIEGSVGGIIVSAIAGFLFHWMFFHEMIQALTMVPLAMVLAIAGQIGDLFESALKRTSGIKDSGQILPGHGGMLDRIDGLLFGIPVIYGYLVFVL